ncbi:tripartite tricarboxylate transporter permease [Polycladidibacter hongkongensis]|uniref:tripartite tricarboxylate transporter permease n=1 Tax=Polycladidibacter hongkongensis TaxID=1647556 RepID=UPI0008312ED4|nr:tripartite tricarboxylate transporter permease [Pseudovibrio hongkongensis]
MDVIFAALGLLWDPTVIGIMLACAVYGLAVGSIPGLSASMAVALLVPMTFFIDAVPALAGIVTLAAMAIFAGDLPGAFLRIPGTPASAAYADEAYKMSLQGKGERALGIGLVCSAIGGVFGALVLLFAAPSLAKIALKFSTFEYFWLACMGLSAAVVVSHGNMAKGMLSLFLGLFIAMIGIDPMSGQIRYTFGNSALIGGLGFIPVLIGFFALSEVMRFAALRVRPTHSASTVGNVFSGLGQDVIRLRYGILRGCGLGTIIGAIPGAGADIASYISYAAQKKLSKNPEKFGTGIVDGIGPASAANNSAVGGAFVPATVFGIPGDSLSAIIIGVLYMKGLNPGPTVFLRQPELITAVFLAFLIANIMLVPFGFAAIKMFKQVLRVPRTLLMPSILAFCIVGAFAVENAVFAVTTMLIVGVLGYLMEENGYPIAPAILGLVLGPMLEENFLSSMMKAHGDFAAFFERPLAAGIAAVTIILWLYPVLSWGFANLKAHRNKALS